MPELAIRCMVRRGEEKMHKFARSTLVTLAVLLGTAPAMAQDLAFDLYNTSSQNVYYFYTSPSNEGDWGYDLLGSEILYSGESAVVYIGDGSDQCLYDFLFETESGASLEVYAINICELSSYTLTD